MTFDRNGRADLRKAAPRFSLAAAGDLCAIGRVERALCEGGAEAVLGPRIREVLSGATARIVNLESPVCEHRAPITKTGPNFITSPRAIPALEAAGFDLVALANNHILDQDVQGLRETLRLLDASGIGHSGAGLTHPEARAACRRTLGGLRVSFLTVAEGEFAQAQEEGPGTARLDPVRTCNDIRRERAASDIVVLSVHAGNEYQPFPSPRLQETYRDFVDAGAHVVIGHHPHIPQGIERRGDSLIIYSLGNFLFDYEGHVGKPCTEIGIVAALDLDARGVAGLRVHPFRKLPDASVELLDSGGTGAFMDYLNDVSAALEDAERLRSLWEQEAVELFEATHRPWIMKTGAAFAGDASEADAYLASYVMYNLFRCEAHHEAGRTALRLMYEKRFTRIPEIADHVALQVRRLEALAAT